MDSEVMNVLSGGSNFILRNEADLRSNKPKSYTATISGFTSVYNILPGEVLFLGSYEGTGTLYVGISRHEMVRYINLKTISVWKGQQLSKGQFIGTTYNRPLQFEYCTVYRQDSPYPVRFNYLTYYKQNPIDVLDGIYWPYMEPTKHSGIVRPGTKVEFTEEEREEWYSYETHIQGFKVSK